MKTWNWKDVFLTEKKKLQQKTQQTNPDLLIKKDQQAMKNISSPMNDEDS